MLVDPWLVGDLTFAKQSWLYSGRKVRTRDVDAPAVARGSDVMLITQVHMRFQARTIQTQRLLCDRMRMKLAAHAGAWLLRADCVERRTVTGGYSRSWLGVQGLDDHCHMPTLERLPRDIPVVAQATAAAACRYGPFSMLLMTGMSHIQRHRDDQHAQTRCCSGSLTAAARRQLGYTDVTELDHGQTVTVAGGQLKLTGTAGRRAT